MDLQRYDIIEAETKHAIGSVQSKRRPYVVVGNVLGTNRSEILVVMPLTHVIKKQHLPTHECINSDKNNGLRTNSMVLGEQPQTIAKEEVLRKLGRITNQRDKNLINRVCWNTFFYGENINWNEVLVK